jgi:immune inhibitor A
MRRNAVLLLSVGAIVAGLMAAPVATAADPGGSAQRMPANTDKIEAALIARGTIPPSASPAEREAAVQAYLQLKTKGGGPDKDYNVRARKTIDANEAALNASASSSSDIRGRKLGKQTSVSASSPQFQPLEGTGKLLLIAVDFSSGSYTWTPAEGPVRTAAGPLHNEIPKPTNSFDLWVPDFSTQHYEDMLFTPGGWTIPEGTPFYAGQQRGSMHDYFLQQSLGKYAVDGQAYGWFTVDKPEAYYGDDRPSGGEDNNTPGTTKDLIADAVAVVNKTNAIPWAEYDTNGDCVIDHPLFIHAGIDQSGGGGAQGDDAIWAHSSSVDQQVAGPTADCPDGLFISNYTIMPEDGGVGVFAHEFAHDLGLPDEYDTIYSGRGDSVAFWTLQSSGSWIGQPAQTQPSGMSIWARYALGWVGQGDGTLIRTSLADLTKDTTVLRLEQAERWGGAGTANGIRVDLPPKAFFVNAPHSGSFEWFGGKADQIDTTLYRTVDLTGKASASLSFWTWYDIEENWDFGFVQVSTDGGKTWKSLSNPNTTSVIDPSGMPEIAANLPGFTGNSGGWVQETFDLAAYAGQVIQLQFRYMTDWGTSLAGFYVDDIVVTADGATVFSDGAETLDPAWTATGWTRDAGSGTKTQYYMLELRNFANMTTPNNDTSIVNFDSGLKTAYQLDPYGSTGNVDEPWWFSYNPGVLLWYRDFTYTDNWTGVHPGGGFLLVVDARSQAMMRAPYLNPKLGGGVLPWNSRVQTYDSTFSLDKAYDATLGYWGVTRTYNGLNAVPTFDDGKSYWDPRAPANSVITPTYGLMFRVLGEATDGSAATIGLGLK